MALGTIVKIASPTGDRTVLFGDFYVPLGNTLEPNEIITEIQIPTYKPGTKQRYFKFRIRGSIDFAISSVAAVITTEAGILTQARIVLGGVALTPYRAVGAEEILRGKVITESTAEISARASVGKSAPLSKNAYKVPITKALVKRALVG